MSDLSHLLGKKSTEVEKPKPFPVGHYVWLISEFAIVESSKKKTPGLELTARMVEPLDDVDQEELATVKEPTKRNKKLTIWITEDSLWRLTEFLETLGVQDEDRTLEELIPEVVGQQFIAAIQHEAIEGSTDVFDKINDRTVSAVE
ncbi:hypothetical protein [Idiomarina abyssalis]|uniref:hypothetical protein n=1 Tax=Idiomarina abyssalis TaxID=86102 RepID=UPI003A94DCC3